tara:strand:- start:580 stop:1062 length:483 start_codon:yes stop_codon:yes gene_type:complete
MALNLDILKDNKNKDSYRKYSYADLSLDLSLDSFKPNTPVGANANPQDLKISYDEEAIFNSIHNIFNTKKGQKILSPEFGLDLEQFLFENITKENATLIGNKIVEELPRFEPRVRVENVNIISRPDDNEYKITMSVIIPLLNNKKRAVTGILNRENFTYI